MQFKFQHINGLVQERHNSIANALELCLLALTHQHVISTVNTVLSTNGLGNQKIKSWQPHIIIPLCSEATWQAATQRSSFSYRKGEVYSTSLHTYLAHPRLTNQSTELRIVLGMSLDVSTDVFDLLAPVACKNTATVYGYTEITSTSYQNKNECICSSDCTRYWKSPCRRTNRYSIHWHLEDLTTVSN